MKINNGNRTEWSSILSVNMRVINKIGQLCQTIAKLESDLLITSIISNSNWTKWSTIQGVIALVISKSNEGEA